MPAGCEIKSINSYKIRRLFQIKMENFRVIAMKKCAIHLMILFVHGRISLPMHSKYGALTNIVHPLGCTIALLRSTDLPPLNACSMRDRLMFLKARPEHRSPNGLKPLLNLGKRKTMQREHPLRLLLRPSRYPQKYEKINIWGKLS